MVDKNLSADITEATTIGASDLLYAVIGGNSRRIKLSNVFTSPVLVTPALGTPSSGVLTNVTGTASGLTAGNVTTNANLTGVITSVGNATSIASQTGTGTKFVVDTSPTLVTPTLGVASGTSLALGGATIGTNALAVTGTSLFNDNVTLAGNKTLNIGNNFAFTTSFNLVSYVSGLIGWSTTASVSTSTTPDTNFSRNAAGIIQFGTNAANAAGSWLATNGTLSGASLITGTADATTTTSGALQVAGGAAIRKRVFMDGLTASAGLQTAVICQSSAGELIADSVACLASSARFKTILGSAEVGAIDKIIRVPIHRWKYKEEGIFQSETWTREHIGPTAEEVEQIDSRLVGYDNEGKARNISQEQLLALAIQAIQEQQVQIEKLQARAA